MALLLVLHVEHAPQQRHHLIDPCVFQRRVAFAGQAGQVGVTDAAVAGEDIFRRPLLQLRAHGPGQAAVGDMLVDGQRAAGAQPAPHVAQPGFEIGHMVQRVESRHVVEAARLELDIAHGGADVFDL